MIECSQPLCSFHVDHEHRIRRLEDEMSAVEDKMDSNSKLLIGNLVAVILALLLLVINLVTSPSSSCSCGDPVASRAIGWFLAMVKNSPQ
jgi:hypothetical protein